MKKVKKPKRAKRALRDGGSSRKRVRGTVSARCPRCRRPSRVLRTALDEKGVMRQRRCPRGHRFWTMETSA